MSIDMEANSQEQASRWLHHTQTLLPKNKPSFFFCQNYKSNRSNKIKTPWTASTDFVQVDDLMPWHQVQVNHHQWTEVTFTQCLGISPEP